MVRILIATIFLVVLFPAAQAQGYEPVRDVVAFRKAFSAGSSRIQSVESDFTQEKHLIALTEKITSTGKFWFRRPNQVRIDYEKPFVYKVILSRDKLFIEDAHRGNQVNVRSNRLFQQINRIMLDCIQGTILESKDFSTEAFEDAKSIRLQMKPVVKNLRDLFAEIVLVVDKKDFSVSTLEMKEASGDRTLMTFTNKKINAGVADETFAF